MNQVCLSGTLVEREALRYTPSGVPVVAGVIAHQSVQEEAGAMRRVELAMPVVAMDQLARRINQLTLGSQWLFRGFLAPRRRHAKALVLHLCAMEEPNLAAEHIALQPSS